MSIIVYPFKKGLNSTKMLRLEGGRVRYPTSRIKSGCAISWGNHHMPPWGDKVEWINHPDGIRVASSKLRWARYFGRTGYHPDWTEDKEVAKEWASVQGEKVVCRTLLNASQGKGIVIARNPEQVVDARMYTKYFKKNREYRVIASVESGVVYAASKRVPQGTELRRDEKLVRTKANGFVFQEKEEIPDVVRSAACRCMFHTTKDIGLNILGLDIAYNSEADTAMILEANTAFGLNEVSAPLVYNELLMIGANDELTSSVRDIT